MQSTFSTLFYPRGNDIDKNGNAPIHLRITVNGKRSEFSIKRKTPFKKWNSNAGKLRGNGQAGTGKPSFCHQNTCVKKRHPKSATWQTPW
ncbi:Arm DNA-binding domain-containing protein [Gillisia sp. Hel_I_86]|uniref:Arm DNA-binding domain-containing protein n=1 Tax=Gillisia sp. Hel_I_86 TaxID=1249981 RepID=UPI0011A822D7|nr:Arm DNA-binding domain-containing protein [Gillisia sp. Hel_I_86]